MRRWLTIFQITRLLDGGQAFKKNREYGCGIVSLPLCFKSLIYFVHCLVISNMYNIFEIYKGKIEKIEGPTHFRWQLNKTQSR